MLCALDVQRSFRASFVVGCGCIEATVQPTTTLGGPRITVVPPYAALEPGAVTRSYQGITLSTALGASEAAAVYGFYRTHQVGIEN